MSWHVFAHLPDGRIACADHREPIVKTIRRWRDKRGDTDQEAITAWLDAHADQSEACATRRCDHDGG